MRYSLIGLLAGLGIMLLFTVFLIGQYNGLIRMRRRMVIEALALDFALRQHLHKLKKSCADNAGTAVKTELPRIESLSHRGAANPISNQGIALLLEAKMILDQMNQHSGTPSCAEVDRRAEACLFLVKEYNECLLHPLPGLMAQVLRFRSVRMVVG